MTRPRLLLAVRWSLVTAMLPGATGALAQQVERQRAEEVAIEADVRTRGFGDHRVRVDMILIDRNGSERIRELELLSLEVSPEEERSIVYFHSPRDIRGTALLTYSVADQDDAQWLYLPALRRTKRIAATGRSSPFMGSEFAYEDLVPARASQFRYEWVGEEEWEAELCFVIDRYPLYRGSGYSKQRLWIDQENYRILRADSWDLRGRELKTLSLGEYQRHGDGIWRPGAARMVNHRTNEQTVLHWYDHELTPGLTESDLRQSALRRVR